MSFPRTEVLLAATVLFAAILAGCTSKARVDMQISETPAGVQSVEIGIYRGACPADAVLNRALNNYDPTLVGTVILERGAEQMGSFLLDEGSFCAVLLGRSPTCEVIAGHAQPFSLASRGDRMLALSLCPSGACAPLIPDPACGPGVDCRDRRGICENREAGFTPPTPDTGPVDAARPGDSGTADSSIGDGSTPMACPEGRYERTCEAGKPCGDTTSSCSEVALCGFQSAHVFMNGNSCSFAPDAGSVARDPLPRETTGPRSPVTLEDALLFPCYTQCLASAPRSLTNARACASCCAGNDLRCGVAATALCMADLCNDSSMVMLGPAPLQECYALRPEFFSIIGETVIAAQIQACRDMMVDQTGLEWTVSMPITVDY